jgi:hypothetical protein
MFQIVLLDEEGVTLGSRYLKSGECLETGKKCTFPNYLIQVGDAKTPSKGWSCTSHSMKQWSYVSNILPVPRETFSFFCEL